MIYSVIHRVSHKNTHANFFVSQKVHDFQNFFTAEFLRKYFMYRYKLQTFLPHLKCVTTLPSEICVLKIATELAVIIQSKLNRTGWFKLWVKLTYFKLACYAAVHFYCYRLLYDGLQQLLFMVALCNRADHYIFALWLWPPYVIGGHYIFAL